MREDLVLRFDNSDLISTISLKYHVPKKPTCSQTFIRIVLVQDSFTFPVPACKKACIKCYMIQVEELMSKCTYLLVFVL